MSHIHKALERLQGTSPRRPEDLADAGHSELGAGVSAFSTERPDEARWDAGVYDGAASPPSPSPDAVLAAQGADDGHRPESAGVVIGSGDARALQGTVTVDHLGRIDAAVVEKLVLSNAIDARLVEQYRRITSILHLTQLEQGLKVVMVASGLPGEGKTLTAVNIALTLSQSHRRNVLLIDGDLRRPMVHEIFNVPNVNGLNEGLAAKMPRRISLVQLSPTLSILPAGRPNPDPMSGLSSDRMRKVIDEASQKFDWVLIDTPPVDMLPDAHLLASLSQGVVLLVEAGRTPHAVVQRTIEVLGRDRVIGVVLNRVRHARPRDEYHTTTTKWDRSTRARAIPP